MHSHNEPGRPAPDASLGELLAHLGEETKRYVELQIELTKMQVLQGVAGGLYDGLKIGAAIALFSLAGLCLVIALALGLSVWLDSYWLGMLATAVLLLVAGGIVLGVAVRTSFLLNIVPKELLRQVRTLSKGPHD